MPRNKLSTAASLHQAFLDATESARLAASFGNHADARAHLEVAELLSRHAAPRCLSLGLMALAGVAS